MNRGVYLVGIDRWYVERTVWLISGLWSLTAALLALAVHPMAILMVVVSGLTSMSVAFTGFCPVSTSLLQLGFEARLADTPRIAGIRVYRLRRDSWYLERWVYAVVGFNLTASSLLVLFHSPWWLAFTVFVGAASLFFAGTGFCVMANLFYRLGASPRLSAKPGGIASASASSAGAVPGETASCGNAHTDAPEANPATTAA